MLHEIDLVRKHFALHELPTRNEPPKSADREEITRRRLMMRTEIDDLIKDGFVRGDIVAFSIRLCRAQLAVAGTAAQFGVIPGYPDFSEAAIDLLQTCQKNLDKALLTQDWSAVKMALAQIETVIYGITASCGIPYGLVLDIINTAYLAKQEVSRLTIAAALREAGLEVPREEGEAANDQ